MIAGLLLALHGGAASAETAPIIEAATLAVVVNDRDPLSRQIADYYVDARAIPEDNLIHVDFEPGQALLPVEQFAAIKPAVDDAAGAHIQAYALAWALPYRVGCMSVTMAFAAGFDKKWCGGICERTSGTPYFDASIRAPWTEFKLRPAMLLAANDFDDARALIDRGIAADGTSPRGTAYLVETEDRNRNSRAGSYPATVRRLADRFRIEHVKAPQLEGRDEVMFYFIGAIRVAGLDSIGFLPGAAADHLTSAGGRLDEDKQMSAMRWLEAGATASYGTVAEPCNFPAKFPNPAVLIRHYLAGETLLEAYWKSVAMPGQGVFIGEPLARPFPHVTRT
ncbi:TIGR03790 family protein [soil metagenome]